MMSRDPYRICYPFGGATIGGSHISILLIIAGLDRTLYEPLVVLHQNGPLRGLLDDRGIPYQMLPLPNLESRGSGPANLTGLLKSAGRLAGFLRKRGVSLVHSSQTMVSRHWVLPCRLAGARLLWDQRGRVSPSRLDDRLRRASHGVLANSLYLRSQLDPLVRERCRVLAPPFRAEGLRPDRGEARRRLLDELHLAPQTRLVGFFANLVDRKRPKVFLEAARFIAGRSAAPCAFLLFGDDRQGRSKGLLTWSRSAGLDGSVHFMGFRSPGDFWIAACDLVLAPSVEEPFGRVLVEAMLAGTPVVAADSGGHREIITHGRNGRLAPSDDPEALAREALNILDDPDSTRLMTEAARREAGERFDAGHIVSAVQDLYQQMLTE